MSKDLRCRLSPTYIDTEDDRIDGRGEAVATKLSCPVFGWATPGRVRHDSCPEASLAKRSERREGIGIQSSYLEDWAKKDSLHFGEVVARWCIFPKDLE